MSTGRNYVHWAVSDDVVESLFEPVVMLQPVADGNGEIVDFTYTKANFAACAYHGVSREQLVGKRVSERLPLAQSSGLLARYAEVFATGVPFMQDHVLLDIPHKGGMRLTSTRCLRAEDGVIVFWQDITELTQAKAEANSTRARLGPVIDSRHDPHVVFAAVRDAFGNIIDYVYVDANDAAAAYDGLTRAELIGSRVSEVLAKSSREPFDVSHLSAVLNWGMPYVANDVSMVAMRDGNREWHWHDQRVVKLDDEHLLSMWRDVTERHVANSQLGSLEEAPEGLLDERGQDIVCALREGAIVWISPAAGRLLGWTDEELVGHPLQEFVDVADRERVLAAGIAPESQGPAQLRLRLRGKLRPSLWVDLEGSLRPQDGTAQTVTVLTMRPIATAQAVLELLEQQAREDALTRLANRYEFFARVPVILSTATMSGLPVGLIFCDIDEFKAVNDAYGHAAGDQLLRIVAERIRLRVRAGDLVARIAGDQFVVVLDRVDGLTAAMGIASELQALIAEPVDIDDHSIGVTASVGVTMALPEEDVDALMTRADAAMYLARSQGRGGVAHF